MKELIDTAKLMVSKDYQDRFKAEYYQTKIRRDKLLKMIINYESGKLEFEPIFSIYLLIIFLIFNKIRILNRAFIALCH